VTPAQEALYPRYVRMLFAHRAHAGNNLKAATIFRNRRGALRTDDVLARAGIRPGRRPETLTRGRRCGFSSR